MKTDQTNHAHNHEGAHGHTHGAIVPSIIATEHGLFKKFLEACFSNHNRKKRRMK